MIFQHFGIYVIANSLYTTYTKHLLEVYCTLLVDKWTYIASRAYIVSTAYSFVLDEKKEEII